MKKLSGETVRLISSGQVITSVSSVVKELVENSLDANADNIEVKLENFGVDKVEVRDNGDGIRPCDRDFMAQKHFTSKITSHSDLESLTTYGFRGEALGSLCAISNVTIATKTKLEDFGRSYVLNQHGMIASSKPAQYGTGTTVTATRLFHNIPVRKQYYGSAKRRQEELRRVEDLLLTFGVVRPSVRFSLSHNKCVIWQKNKAPDLRAALLNTVGSNVMGQLQYVEKSHAESQVEIQGYLPKLHSDPHLVTRSTDDRVWTSVNGRPVFLKNMTKVVKQYYNQAHPNAVTVRHLVMCLSIKTPPHLLDINLEPNKTKVLMQNKEAVLSLVTEILEELYNQPPSPTKGDCSGQVLACEQMENGESENVQLVPQVEHQLTSDNNKITVSMAESEMRSDQSGHQKECVSSGEEKMETDRTGNSEASINGGNGVTVNGIEVKNTTTCAGDTQPTFSLSDGEDDDLLAMCLEDFAAFDSPDSVGREMAALDGVESNISKTCDSADIDGVKPCSDETGHTMRNDSRHDDGDAVGWSKGLALSDQSGRSVQPSVLLVPGKTLSLQGENDKHSERNSAGPKLPQTTEGDSVSALHSPTNQEMAHRPRGDSSGNDVGPSEESAGLVQSNQSPGRQNSASVEEKTSGTNYECIGPSPTRHSQEAFTFFAKEHKSDVKKKHPNLDFVAINKILKTCWDQLNEEERENYRELQLKEKQRHKDQMKSAKLFSTSINSGLPAKKKKRTEKLSNQSLIDEMLASQRERKRQEIEASRKTEDAASQRPELTVAFSINALQRAPSHTRKSFRDDERHLIGRLPGYGIWLAIRANHLTVFNQYRAQEVVLYHHLLASHKLPRERLPVPITLSPSMFGDRNWSALLGMRSLVTLANQSHPFIDSRLLGNGFGIRELIDPDAKDARLEIVDMASNIPCYGLDDLKEVVEAVATKSTATLAECRSLKVSNYLMGEAVRMARCLPEVMTWEEVVDIMNAVDNLASWKSKLCLHGKSFEKDLYTIPDIIASE
ncbi:PMS1 protein homolog 1-like [Diadema antillarum]|uniref:PMS1 protein homolog 1-like n=1 Tax=Diadema antillarum TaxID=105358 RepID=UPI003A88752D